MVVNLLIKLVNNSSAVYHPGQTVQACVELFLTERKQVKAIYAKFKGESRTSWADSDINRKSEENHSESELYFKTEIPVLQAIGDGYENIEPGTHTYPVSFLLPSVIPSSFEGKSGSVRYLVKAKLKIKGGDIYRTNQLFTVIYQLDLNTIPSTRMPTQIQDTKTGCCLCCKTGPVFCMLRLDKQGYVPGQWININAEVTNHGNSSIRKTTIELVMTTNYRAYGSKTEDSREIASKSHGAVGPGETDIWHDTQLLVLPTPPSYLYGCSLIDIQYSCRLVADMEGSLMNINFDLPVIIGTHMLHDDEPASSYGQPSEQNWESGDDQQTDHISLDNIEIAGPITTQPGHPTDAPPSYEECMTTDKVQVMRQNSNTADQGEVFTNFAPSYPYYKT